MQSVYQEIGKEEIKTGSRTKNWNEAKWIEFIEELIEKDRTEQREVLKAFQEYYQTGEYNDEYTFDENINRFLKRL